MKRGSTEKRFLVGLMGVVLLLTIFPISGYAEILRKINYQGYLTDAAGVPVNGTAQMVFSIYDAPAGGSLLWSEVKNVSVSRGIYNVTLGDSSFMYLGFDFPYYLGVKVGGDPEMVPRTPLTSVGYAYHALTAEYCPPGLQGPTGPQGPQGLQGLPGPQGPQGPTVTTTAVCVSAPPNYNSNGECYCSIRYVTKVYSGPNSYCGVTSDTGSCSAIGNGNMGRVGSCCVCAPY